MMEIANTMLSSELQVFLNYVYEYKKGVRNMVLCTLNRRYLAAAVARLDDQGICHFEQSANENNVNLYFGKPECIAAVRQFIVRAAPSVVARGGFHPRSTAWLRHLPAVRAVLHAQEASRRYGAVRRMKELTKCLFKPSRRGRRKRKASPERDSPF